MRMVLLCFLLTFTTDLFAAPPSFIIKNQYGEQSNNIVLGGTFASGQLLFQTESITVAHALSTTVAESIVSNASGSSIAVTLAAPSNQDGQIKVVKAGATMTHTVTLAMTNIKTPGFLVPTTGVSGTTTLTFTAAGDCAIFMAIGGKWQLIGGNAVAS